MRSKLVENFSQICHMSGRWSVHKLPRNVEEERVVTSSYVDKVAASWACTLDFGESAQERHNEYSTELFWVSLDIREFNHKSKFIRIQAPLVLLSYWQKNLSKLCSRDSWQCGLNLGILIMETSRYHLACFLKEIQARMSLTWGPVRLR